MGGHLVSRHTVEAQGGSAPRFQILKERTGIGAVEEIAAGLHGEADHGGTRALQLGGGEDGLCLLGVHQGLTDQQVRPAVYESPDLTAVVFYHQVKVRRIPAVTVGCQGGDITGYQAARGSGPAEGDELAVDGLTVLVQPDFFQGNGLGLEGRRVDNSASRLGVAPLKPHKDLWVAQDPLFGSNPIGHAHFSQIGAGGPVQQPWTGAQGRVKCFLCQHNESLVS